LVFVKALKAVAMAHALIPLAGCAAGLGLVFNGFIRGISYAPDMEDVLFSHTMLGFALIESFMVIAVAVVGMVYTF
jgi:F0F1-type ATP synthase membrane subunit c/vacuolar-type H+-ATPase subunit K